MKIIKQLLFTPLLFLFFTNIQAMETESPGQEESLEWEVITHADEKEQVTYNRWSALSSAAGFITSSAQQIQHLFTAHDADVDEWQALSAATRTFAKLLDHKALNSDNQNRSKNRHKKIYLQTFIICFADLARSQKKTEISFTDYESFKQLCSVIHRGVGLFIETLPENFYVIRNILTEISTLPTDHNASSFFAPLTPEDKKQPALITQQEVAYLAGKFAHWGRRLDAVLGAKP